MNATAAVCRSWGGGGVGLCSWRLCFCLLNLVFTGPVTVVTVSSLTSTAAALSLTEGGFCTTLKHCKHSTTMVVQMVLISSIFSLKATNGQSVVRTRSTTAESGWYLYKIKLMHSSATLLGTLAQFLVYTNS